MTGASIPKGRVWAKYRLPFHAFLTLLFTLIIFVSGITIAMVNYWHTRQALIYAAQQNFVSIGTEIDDHLDRFQEPAVAAVSYLSRSVLVKAEKLERRLPIMTEVLLQNPAMEAVFAGYPNGDFLVLSPLSREHTHYERVNAPADAYYVLRSGEQNQEMGKSTNHIFFLGQDLQILSKEKLENFNFDPRLRPWYQEALESKSAIMTAPYVFTITEEIGQSVARQSPDQKAVVGASITLKKLSSQLQKARALIPAHSAELVLFDGEGKVLSDSRSENIIYKTPERELQRIRLDKMNNPVARHFDALFRAHKFNTPISLDVDGSPWLMQISRVKREGDNASFYLAVAAPKAELLAEAQEQLKYGVLLTALVLVLTVPITWYMSYRISKKLRRLTDDAQAIQRFDFSNRDQPTSMIKEVQELAEATNHARRTIRHFLDISSSLSAEQNFSHLMVRILQENISAAEASAGVLYLLNEYQTILMPEAAYGVNPTEEGKHCSEEKLASLLKPIPIDKQTTCLIGQSALTGETTIGSLLSDNLENGLKTLLGDTNNHAIVWVVPLKKRNNEIVGMLCLYRNDTYETVIPTQDMTSFIEQLSGGTAVSIENHRLLLSQRALLDGLIQLIASAIDSKSPYTGGHCQRVPELTRMLAQAACADKTGPFAEFDLDEDGWEALRIGTWLHDCGKVTTPEHVVDKATKLETIYDRIHEIRMRFEVLKRDVEIVYWQALFQGIEEPEARARRDQEWQQLDDDFSFVAKCNEGGEFMTAPERLERLHSIAQRTWKRTFSDRIGISWNEKQRKAQSPEPELPVDEPLLADKPEHLIQHGVDAPMLTDNSWG
ncbi:MAG: hypothetical protein ACRDD3_11035, partial [Azovibrio sp.]